MTAAHGEGGGTRHAAALSTRPIPQRRSRKHEHANTAHRQHSGPAAPAGGHAVLPPVRRGPQGGRGRGHRPRPAARSAGRMSPAGRAAVFAAAVLAAALPAPPGVTAGIQADPVCLPVTAQPGHSYPLTVYVSGSGPLTLAVIPAHGTLERHLHQVPASWVRFAPDPAGTGQVALTLDVPPGAAPGAYWSDVVAGTQGQAQPGPGGQAVFGAAAATAIVLTVGPSAIPPPLCDALDLAQSTGKFPAWPAKAGASASWAQVLAREKPAPDPHASPTAASASGAHAAPAAARSPAANMTPAARHPAPWTGWVIVIIAVLLILRWFARLLKGRKLCPPTVTAGSSSSCSCSPSPRRCCWPPGTGGGEAAPRR